MIPVCRRLVLLAAIFVLAVSRPLAQTPSAQAWLAYADPAAAGFNATRLEEARAHADANRSAAVMAVYRGRVIAAWGAVDRPLMAHSVRKSLAGAVYGIAVHDGALSLDATLAQLRVTDEPALTPEESRATFRDLIASRSGVYHGAAYADGAQEAQRPARGSHTPGSFFFYNNWDFNAAEAVYERATGDSLYAAFDRRIARVLGMEDFDPARQFEVLEPGQSRMPAHTFRISARDLARFGQLYLQNGRWGDRQVVPAEWVRDSFRMHSSTGDRMGYGYLWWIYQSGSLGAAFPMLNTLDVYLARGTGGQTIFVIPGVDMVVVHRGDTDNGRSVPGPAIWQLVERLVAARDGQPQATPALVPMRVLPLSSNVPAPVEAAYIPVTAGMRAAVTGTYEVAPGMVARVFEWEGRLFMSIPRQGEAELFATAPTTFTIKAQPGVVVAFRSAADGAVNGVTVTIGRQVIEAARR